MTAVTQITQNRLSKVCLPITSILRQHNDPKNNNNNYIIY